MEIYIEYMQLSKRNLKIGYLSSKGMQGNIVSSSAFPASLTVFEMEEVGIQWTPLINVLCMLVSKLQLSVADRWNRKASGYEKQTSVKTLNGIKTLFFCIWESGGSKQ